MHEVPGVVETTDGRLVTARHAVGKRRAIAEPSAFPRHVDADTGITRLRHRAGGVGDDDWSGWRCGWGRRHGGWFRWWLALIEGMRDELSGSILDQAILGVDCGIL